MNFNNFFNSIEVDLRQALAAKAEVDELFAAREAARDRAQLKFQNATEEFREVSIIRSQIAQKIGELQGERFNTDESFEEWL